MRGSETLLLALGLGLDAFSVALGVGAVSAQPRQVFRLAWHFGLFQFSMPLLGWQLGQALTLLVGQYTRWTASGILFFLGAKMVLHSLRWSPSAEELEPIDRTRGWSLIALSLATSMDALGAGVGLGLVRAELLQTCAVIGLGAALMTVAGMLLGQRLSPAVGSRAEALGGAVLLALAGKMLLV